MASCGRMIGLSALGLLIVGNIWLIKRYATLVRQHIKGGATAKYVYLNLLTQASGIGIQRSYDTFMFPMDTRNKRMFSLIRRGYWLRALSFSIGYWLLVLALWAWIESACRQLG
jgi:hypothetical protein